ncbi:MAG: sulfide/dihydroorotate dehydrogenase-like FAD/NAD-binding protein [Oscillospiraceae bacterium]|nr:sulfide/dihydroorotate dehydrogenase-like FAD/NAD-binding protein [Oscillospiraceae bacterium]
MYKIVKKRRLNDTVTLIEVTAPAIAKKARAGQFIILRVDEYGERIPLTIADTDKENGTVTVIFQIVGRTTMLLDQLEVGECLADFVGPLGNPSEIEGIKKAIVVGGGVGCAIAYPIAKALHELGAQVDVIAGFRSKDIVILKDEMEAACTNYYLMTDDGTAGEKGFTTTKLQQLLEADSSYDLVVAIGPVIMMKFTVATAKPFGVPTMVSLNPIMIDGTGMCGGCRVTINGERKFACVDGPDFDGYAVDFDELMSRNAFYKAQETHDKEHVCRLTGGVRNYE